MDRRDFLKALAAIGAAGVSARSLASASGRTIEWIWQNVASEPQIFYVRDEYPDYRSAVAMPRAGRHRMRQPSLPSERYHILR